MLFLLKRRWTTALAGLIVLTGLGLVLREFVDESPTLSLSPSTVLLGIALFAAVLVSDVVAHGLLNLTLGDRYRARHQELVEVFRDQSWPAMLAGAAMAGIGEELLFRGVSSHPAYLAGGVVLFAALHHVRRSLWLFTVWAGYQGLLLTLGLCVTGLLGVTMVAHFLHDLAGFWIFKCHAAKPCK